MKWTFAPCQMGHTSTSKVSSPESEANSRTKGLPINCEAAPFSRASVGKSLDCLPNREDTRLRGSAMLLLCLGFCSDQQVFEIWQPSLHTDARTSALTGVSHSCRVCRVWRQAQTQLKAEIRGGHGEAHRAALNILVFAVTVYKQMSP